jgi:sugar lactone lactonase YvrE
MISLRLSMIVCVLMLTVTLGCIGSAPTGPTGPPARVLAKGAAISGTNGLHFGPDGSLYVASVIGSEIVVLDPETGTVERRIAEGVDGPDDVAFRSDGSLYWTSILTGEVAGFRPDGTRVTAARLTPGVNPITFSPDDRLFVSQCFFDDKLYEVDPDGIREPRLISDQLGPGCGLNGMDWGPDGRLYGPRWYLGEVVSFDVDTMEMRTEARGFQIPAAVKFDSHGRLHVLDTAAGTVVRVDGDRREIVATLSPGLDNIAFDARDRLFVSSFVDGFVARIDADGTKKLLTPSGISHPGGLTLRIGEAGLEVIIADFQSIRGFDAATGKPTFINRNVFAVSELGAVTNISTDVATNQTNLILVSWLEGSVKIWDSSKEEVVASYLELAAPVSALRYEGRLVVAEHGKGRVIAINPQRSVPIEVIASGLPAPTGLVERAGDLFITDRELGQLLRIAKDGTRLEKVEVLASNLPSPEGVAATVDGFIVVDGKSGKLFGIDAKGKRTHLTDLAPGAPASSATQPPSMIFNGVVVSREGVAYATGETNRVLYRIDLE